MYEYDARPPKSIVHTDAVSKLKVHEGMPAILYLLRHILFNFGTMCGIWEYETAYLHVSVHAFGGRWLF